MTEGNWLRVCVDVEPDGNVSGWSVERYEDFTHVQTHVRPFISWEITAEDAFRHALQEGIERFGVQQVLPFP